MAAEITAQMIKDLRERTGAGMSDCKKALTEVGGDMDKAIDYLRAKGLAKAAKKAGREATEGAVVSNTARELQLERSHLYKKMRALGIDHRADDEAE